MIVVDEHPSVTEHDLNPGPLRRIASAGMWLPIRRHEDGYGLSYGARYSVSDLLGEGSRVSMPLSWGDQTRPGPTPSRAGPDDPDHGARRVAPGRAA
jgi:hypothetical protein